MQAPQDSFTVSGSTIVFASTLASTDSIDFIMALGDVLDIGTPSDGTVTSAKLAGALTTPSNLTVGGVLDATTATFDRASTDGVIVNLQKNNGSVGSIGTNAETMYVSAPQAGGMKYSYLNSTNAVMLPVTTTGANADGLHDLGYSAARFKDLYLSGGAYLGGTTSANKLTDYEQGTWAPVDLNGNAYNQAVTATYVKIGKLVFVYMDITSNSATVASGSNQVAGLPFTTATSSNAGTISQGYQSGTGNVTGHMYGTSIYLMNGQSTSIVLNQRLIASGVYHTN
jgi:hypothetical protein